MKVIVVGSGAGGATAARELSLRGNEVTVLEAGRQFKPFTRHLGWANALRGPGLLRDEDVIGLVFPHMRTIRSSRDLVLVRGVTTGGCTALSCGNAVRAENGLREIGLDLSREFEEVEAMLDPKPMPRGRWRPVTQRMFDVAEEIGLRPSPTPKMVDPYRCVSCGLCELGCKTGARWDSTKLLREAEANGARVIVNSRVERVLFEGGRARGVEVSRFGGSSRVVADAVVLAAGGVGTAQILENSGVPAKERLWTDVVVTLGGVMKDARQFREAPMNWYSKRDGYILSPYPDILSHLFHGPWSDVSEDDRVGVMVKLADEEQGAVHRDGGVDKALTGIDEARIEEGLSYAREVMESAGVGGPFVRGLANGGHLGGTVPLSPDDVRGMRPSWLPEGLWVADLSLLPRSQGLPTIMTTMALAMRVARQLVV